MIKLVKSATWLRRARHLHSLIKAWPQAVHQATLQEAHLLRRLIVDGITAQALGEERALKPLTVLSLAGRRLAGFHGTKALLRHGDLRNSVSVAPRGKAAFVGVLRQAKDRRGRGLVDLAAIHEWGTPPIVIKVTPRMRRFLAVLMAEAGIGGSSKSRSGCPYVVVKIPARPFMRPTGRRFKQGLRKRFVQRIQSLLRKDADTP